MRLAAVWIVLAQPQQTDTANSHNQPSLVAALFEARATTRCVPAGCVLACSIDDFQDIITVDIEVDKVLTNLTVCVCGCCA